MLGKLFLYDTDYWLNRSQAKRRLAETSMDVIAADSEDTLHAGFASLVKKRKFFDRVLFQTHGDPHAIWFGGYAIYPYRWPDFKQ